MLEWTLSFMSGIYATTSPCDAAAEGIVVAAAPSKC
jgi:hypothetical protein